jgi:NAD-dependent SIR2 family protein deacetylase
MYNFRNILYENGSLTFTAGAGMDIDSGMPDFRGENGFWTAYPALRGLGMRFHEIANPKAFHSLPTVAWGFYAHRLMLYRNTSPHAGFDMLKGISSKMPEGAFVFTSNVDGHFQKAGFSPKHIAECHGSIHHLQCLNDCGQPVWSAVDFLPVVDIDTCMLISPCPVCPSCGGTARPNIMMFGDHDFDSAHADRQRDRLETWLARLHRPVVIEIRAGTAIATVRGYGEWIDRPMIRINPTESAVGLLRDISISLGALNAIIRISQALDDL